MAAGEDKRKPHHSVIRVGEGAIVGKKVLRAREGGAEACTGVCSVTLSLVPHPKSSATDGAL